MIRIECIEVGPLQQNSRLLVDQKTNRCVVVDPGADAPMIFSRIRDQSLEVEGLFLTHSHLDHAGGVAHLLRLCEEHFGSKPNLLGCHNREEAYMRSSIVQVASMFGASPELFENCPEPDVYVGEGDKLIFGESSGEILFTPGHSPGHLSVYFEGVEFLRIGSNGKSSPKTPETVPFLIAGDTLFSGSIGRTDLPGGEQAVLLKSLKEKILTLPDETLVLSGHGPDTSVGVEKRSNPFL